LLAHGCDKYVVWQSTPKRQICRFGTERVRHFQQYFSYIMATRFNGERNRREPPTMGKQVVNFIMNESKTNM
jgi:hypothetical protein